jgi:kinetochore protein NDC80
MFFPSIPSFQSICYIFANVPLQIRHEQLTIRAAALREELHTEIEKILNDVIRFKIHVQKNLEEYEAFVDEEVNREYESLQQAEDEENLGQDMQVEGDAEVGASDDVEM